MLDHMQSDHKVERSGSKKQSKGAEGGQCQHQSRDAQQLVQGTNLHNALHVAEVAGQ